MAEKLIPPPWYRPNRYDAAGAWAKWFEGDQARKPDATDAFVAGSQWEYLRAAIAKAEGRAP